MENYFAHYHLYKHNTKITCILQYAQHTAQPFFGLALFAWLHHSSHRHPFVSDFIFYWDFHSLFFCLFTWVSVSLYFFLFFCCLTRLVYIIVRWIGIIYEHIHQLVSRWWLHVMWVLPLRYWVASSFVFKTFSYAHAYQHAEEVIMIIVIIHQIGSTSLLVEQSSLKLFWCDANYTGFFVAEGHP